MSQLNHIQERTVLRILSPEFLCVPNVNQQRSGSDTRSPRPLIGDVQALRQSLNSLNRSRRKMESEVQFLEVSEFESWSGFTRSCPRYCLTPTTEPRCFLLLLASILYLSFRCVLCPNLFASCISSQFSNYTDNGVDLRKLQGDSWR